MGILTVIGAFVSLVGAVILGALINGWALSLMWGWFIVPLFNLPPISILQGISLFLVIGLFRNKLGNANESSADKDLRDEVIDLLVILLSPLFTLLLGWILLQFM